jgi:AcrR family transcriptional regulator
MSDPVEQELPRAVAMAWGIAANPQRGPKRELSHELIVEAAMGIADAEGLGAVTMSRVASSLGFTTMSLYRYVTSKDDLLVLMADAASEISYPEDGWGDDWRANMWDWAALLRGCYRDHTWLLEINRTPSLLMTPNNMAVVDLGLRALRPARLENLLVALGERAQGDVRQLGGHPHLLHHGEDRGELALAAVEQDQVGSGHELLVAPLEPLEAAADDLGHARGVVGALDAPDLEPPVLLLGRPAALEDDHRGDGVGSHGVGDVVALYPDR